jgi:small subunit ribosomal protein S8
MIEAINLFTKIKNAQAVNKKFITVNSSKLIKAILDILVQSGYILKVNSKEKSRVLNVELKYLEDGRPAIAEIQSISKPGLRIYRSYRNFKDFIGKRGILILSTPKGLMTNKKAFEQKIGGEIICRVE